MKPQDLLLGIRDFFSILIPGAIFLALIDRPADLPKMEPTFLAVAFSVASYLCGTVASGVSSVLDPLVDAAIRSIRLRSLTEVLKERVPQPLRGSGPSLLDAETWAQKVQAKIVGNCPPEIAGAGLSLESKNFWRGHLRMNCPTAIDEVDRFEAAQKLARSLIVVFLVLAAIAGFPRLPLSACSLEWSHLLIACGCAAVAYIVGRVRCLLTVYRWAASYGVNAYMKLS